jgi:GTP-binding protein
VINKIDKPTAQPEAVVDMLFDLFVQLGATDEQLDITDGRIVYAIAREGIAIKHSDWSNENITPLFDTILEEVAESANDTTKPFKMQIANLAYDNYVGRMGIGRVYEGKAKVGQTVTIVGNDGVAELERYQSSIRLSDLRRSKSMKERQEISSRSLVSQISM